MRAKCPKCSAVFDVKLGVSLVHIGPYRYTKCPACGKSGMMNNFVNGPITWPPEEAQTAEQNTAPLSDEEIQKRAENLKKKRIEESKYDNPE